MKKIPGRGDFSEGLLPFGRGFLMGMTAVADAVQFVFENFSHNGIEIPKGRRVQGIKNILPVPPVDDKARLHQHLHVMGQGGLGNGKGLLQPAGALLPAGQHVHDFQPFGVGNGFQDFGGINVNLFHMQSKLLCQIELFL